MAYVGRGERNAEARPSSSGVAYAAEQHG
eukprot:COSAG04_NODE_33405_length_152_cov_15.735849_1_plen_28_part_01